MTDLAGQLLLPHHDLERAITGARIAGIAGDDALLARWLAHLRAILAPHVALEEELLLPLWAEVADPPPNGTAAILRAEHQRILGLLADAEREGIGDPVRSADRLARLAGVLEHHDAREASGFVPTVAAMLDDAGRQRVAARILPAPPAPPLPGPTIARPPPPFGDTFADRVAAVRFALATDADAIPVDALALALEAHLADHPQVAPKARRALRRVLDPLTTPPTGDPVAHRLGRLAAFDALRLLELAATAIP